MQLPVSFSDHQQITLHVSSKGPPERHRGQPRPVIYPICTSTPTQVHGDLVDELIRMGVGCNVDSRSWDTTVQKCSTSIKRIRKRDNQRLCRMRRRFRIQACTHLLSRRAILQIFRTIFVRYRPSVTAYDWNESWKVCSGNLNAPQTGKKTKLLLLLGCFKSMGSLFAVGTRS